jgi:hypothetical protein
MPGFNRAIRGKALDYWLFLGCGKGKIIEKSAAQETSCPLQEILSKLSDV